MLDLLRSKFRIALAGVGVAGALSLVAGLLAAPASALPAGGTGQGFIGGFNNVSKVASTVPDLGKGKPGNGDVNPYGVAVVAKSTGTLVAGDVLVSNFNNAANAQGTGTTIMQLSPAGKASVWANLAGQVKAPIGLTTALSVFPNGDVVVGSLPTTNGMAATATAGALYVLNSKGKVIETLKGGDINGPWDMTSYAGPDWGVLFVTNVLNGTVAAKGKTVAKGTVVRIVLDFSVSPPKMVDNFVIGSGFDEATNASALVLGPTGVGLSANDTLYVADTMRNRVAAIPDALFRHTSDGLGATISTGEFLKAPLGLAIAPNGDILTVNGNDGEITETTAKGSQINWIFLDSSGSAGAGTLFGLAVQPGNKGIYFVDDGENQLNLFH
ncbi:MAG TPA: hypothetical protein VGP46_00050 [Acidimicrobiales bacterium]|jgi:hypothetical protein|nr:hypothetical protein [Acidimicrobiales bacterium]